MLYVIVLYCIVASGKRRRKVYNPDQWASSTLSKRTKVLALGVSYPSVKDQIKSEISSKVSAGIVCYFLFAVLCCIELDQYQYQYQCIIQ